MASRFSIGGSVRRTSLLLLLLSWIPAFSAGIEATHAGGLPIAEALAVHAAGPGQPQPPQATYADVAPETTVRVDRGPSPVPVPAGRTTSRRHTAFRRSATAQDSAERRRVNDAPAQTRARTGFLTASSSTAPPPTHG